MARQFLTAINLNKNELQNPVAHPLAAAPSSPVKGQFYMNTTDNTLYWWDGTTWIPAKATGGAFPGYGAVPAETTFGIAKADGAATTVARSDHTHGSPAHNAAEHSTIPLSALAAAAGNINMGGNQIDNVAPPTSGTDAANKDYVDNLIAGLSWKDSCRAGTTANMTLSGVVTPVDGITLIAGERVLVKNQTNPIENGIYLAQSGVAWIRATDSDATGELNGAAVFIEAGTTQADTAWVCTTDSLVTPGTHANAWVQFGAGAVYTAGAGMTATGNTFNVIAADGSLSIGSDSMQVAFAGTGSAVTAAKSDHVHTGTYPRMFTALVGGSTAQVINHALNTRYLIAQVWRETTPWDTIDCDVERTDTNNVTLRFTTAPAAGEYRVLIAAQ